MHFHCNDLTSLPLYFSGDWWDCHALYEHISLDSESSDMPVQCTSVWRTSLTSLNLMSPHFVLLTSRPVCTLLQMKVLLIVYTRASLHPSISPPQLPGCHRPILHYFRNSLTCPLMSPKMGALCAPLLLEQVSPVSRSCVYPLFTYSHGLCVRPFSPVVSG